MQHFFITTGAVITVTFALVATALSLKGALLLYGGRFSIDGTNSWVIEPAIIGASFTIVVFIGVGLATFAWIANQGEERERARKDNGRQLPERFFVSRSHNRPWYVRLLWALFFWVIMPIILVWMIFVAVNQTILALKGLSWFFTGYFSLVGISEMPYAWIPQPKEIALGVATTIALGISSIIVCVVAGEIKKSDKLSGFAFPLRTRPHSEMVTMIDQSLSTTDVEVSSSLSDSPHIEV